MMRRDGARFPGAPPINSEELPERRCERANGDLPSAKLEAHGPHPWEDRAWDGDEEYWCLGLPAHPNTMIGRRS